MLRHLCFIFNILKSKTQHSCHLYCTSWAPRCCPRYNNHRGNSAGEGCSYLPMKVPSKSFKPFQRLAGTDKILKIAFWCMYRISFYMHLVKSCEFKIRTKHLNFIYFIDDIDNKFSKTCYKQVTKWVQL